MSRVLSVSVVGALHCTEIFLNFSRVYIANNQVSDEYRVSKSEFGASLVDRLDVDAGAGTAFFAILLFKFLDLITLIFDGLI